MDQETGQRDPDAVGRTAHPGLVIGRARHREPQNIATASEEEYLHSLHAVEVGSRAALCGEEVVPLTRTGPGHQPSGTPARGASRRSPNAAVASAAPVKPTSSTVVGRTPSPGRGRPNVS